MHLDISNADFYDRTAWLLGTTQISLRDRARASLIDRVGPAPLNILELGAGFGGTAAASADLGHRVVAVEASPRRAAFARTHLKKKRSGILEVLQADFNSLELEASFDVIAYWSGFGLGDDAAQLNLLKRIHAWLKTQGRVFIDVFDPNWWSAASGSLSTKNGIRRQLGFDSATGRLTVTYWPAAQPASTITETIKCYSFQRLSELVAQSGLFLAEPSSETSDHSSHSYLVVLAKEKST